MSGPRPTLTREQAADAVARHGSRRAAARALGVDESTVRRTLTRPDPPPLDLEQAAPTPVEQGTRPRIRYGPPPQLDALDALLGAARGAVARGDLLAVGVALDRAARTSTLLRLAVANVDT